MTLTFRKPDDVIDAFVSGEISRDQMECILRFEGFDLTPWEYTDCLLEADNRKAASRYEARSYADHTGRHVQ